MAWPVMPALPTFEVAIFYISFTLITLCLLSLMNFNFLVEIPRLSCAFRSRALLSGAGQAYN